MPCLSPLSKDPIDPCDTRFPNRDSREALLSREGHDPCEDLFSKLLLLPLALDPLSPDHHKASVSKKFKLKTSSVNPNSNLLVSSLHDICQNDGMHIGNFTLTTE